MKNWKKFLTIGLSVCLITANMSMMTLADDVSVEETEELVEKDVVDGIPDTGEERAVADAVLESSEIENDVKESDEEKELLLGEESGTCGDNVRWIFKDGVLTITGSGPLEVSGPYYDEIPWYYCKADIESVVVGAGITSIGNFVFSDLYNLKSLSIPNTVTSIGGWVYGYPDYEYGPTIDEIRFSGTIEKWLEIGGVPYAGYDLYVNNRKITNVTIPNSVTSIERAFGNCSSLTSVTIPNSVTSIGDDAFSGCSSLTSVTIPNSVMSIGNDAFSGCSSLTSVTIPNSVMSIGYGAFSDCSSMTSVVIPDSVTSIGGSTFSGCSSMTSVTIPNSVTSIGGSAFSDCSSLTSVTIPNSVTSIGGSAFSGCSSMTRVTIPNSVTSIESWAFGGCSSMTSVTIPNSVTSIKVGAFSGCSSMTRVTIPNSVTSIESWAFSDCSSLTSVTIPNSVTSITDGAFQNSPNVVAEVEEGSYAYSYCVSKNVKVVYQHKWDAGTEMRAATCNADGVKLFICDICGRSKVESDPATNEHKWYVKGVTKVPTCTEKGIMTTTCVSCGLTKDEDIAALGHHETTVAAVTATCKKVGYTGDTYCDMCEEILKAGQEIPKKEHKWNAGVITKAATVTEEGVKTYTCSECKETKTEKISKLTPTPTPIVQKQSMYRLYNPNSGEHFYTASAGEKNGLVKLGWAYEGIGWTAPKTSKTPVYRLYNPNSGDHHYTTNKGEKDMLVRVGWDYEQIGWYSDDAKGVPLYRQYNPNCTGAGSHNYTTSKGENDMLVRIGWKAEGIGWYGMK